MNPKNTSTANAIPGSHAPHTDGALGAMAPAAKVPPATAKLASHSSAKNPARSTPTMTATLVAMLITPFARAISRRATNSAIMPYLAGPKNALMMANKISAAMANHASPNPNPSAARTTTPNAANFNTTVTDRLEFRSAMRPAHADSTMNGTVKATPIQPPPPWPNTSSHGLPAATAIVRSVFTTLSVDASTNCVAKSEMKPRFHSGALPAMPRSSVGSMWIRLSPA